MDTQGTTAEHQFLLPVALIFQNDSSLDESPALEYNITSGPIPNETNLTWKKVFVNGPHRNEKIGDTLRRELKWAFILHTYGFGCIFFILAFYTFFSVLNLRSFISTRPYMSTINGFLCLLGSSRAASLFIDPYNLKENMPKLIGQVLWDLGFPSIISAFCLVQLAFLQLTQLQIGPESFRRKSSLSLVITAHFLLTIGMDILVASNENFAAVKLIFQYIFLTWGVFLCSNFLYSGYKIMSIIRNMPGGLKHRNLPDPSYKGIMQLAMLAPQNNFAGSMTAALIPTLCTLKIHHQETIGVSTVGFKNDGNPRILESESIPMLEEMTTSSGDETNPKPLARVSSLQNQSRTPQKFNLKPKLSLKSKGVEIEDAVERTADNKKINSIKSPKNQLPNLMQKKPVEFNFNLKTNNEIVRDAENFAMTAGDAGFKFKNNQKTGFENENFQFTNKKTSKIAESDSKKRQNEPLANINKAWISSENKSFDGCGSEEDLSVAGKKIKNDQSQAEILREGRNTDSEESTETRKKSSNEKHRRAAETSAENRIQSIADSKENVTGDLRDRPESFADGFPSDKNGINLCRRENDLTLEEPIYEQGRPPSNTRETSEFESADTIPRRINRKKKMKSLTWKKKDSHEEEEEIAIQESLLPQENFIDKSLQSVLNQVAYVNRSGPSQRSSNEDDLEKDKKSKVEWVLNITYITAMWGLMLCLSNMGKIYSPFEVPEFRKILPPSNSSNYRAVAEKNENGIFLSSWPWLWFQTFCRALELAMGCAMANITRQPTATQRYSRVLNPRHRDAF